jgi:SAM-dependent methyltransferase
MGKIRKLAKRVLRGRGQALAKSAFPGVAPYWETRYAQGGTSGAGSAGRLAPFKAEVLNAFVEQHGVNTVFELGCGDGTQLTPARYPSYVGVDVSPTAVDLCRRRPFDRDNPDDTSFADFYVYERLNENVRG